jgi:rhamnosyltransferase
MQQSFEKLRYGIFSAINKENPAHESLQQLCCRGIDLMQKRMSPTWIVRRSLRLQSNSVCAVIVTFHPEPDVVENLSKVRQQVQGLVVVDNGSPQDAIQRLRSASHQLGFELIENGENLGIGAALNTGIRWVQANTFEWVILFDQDSAVTDGFMDAMLHAFENISKRDRLGILVPRYVDKRSGIPLPQDAAKSGGLETAMTSGSLMRVSSFREHGLFEEELFIDSVDSEYSLRLRKNGYLIEECRDAVLLHSPGDPTVLRLYGIRLFQTANYSAVRRYYQDRNRIWLTRKYWRVFPKFCLRLYRDSFKEHAKTILGEGQKWSKCYYAGLGILDGLRGHMGKFDRKKS